MEERLLIADGAPDQYAALAWRRHQGRLEYLLVTSRRTGRWIFPKGGRDPGESPGEAARREAEEEAGVSGRPGPAPIGLYVALKVTGEGETLLTVELWPVEIDNLAERWQEERHRRRRIVGLEAARALIGQEDMRRLLERFDRAERGR